MFTSLVIHRRYAFYSYFLYDSRYLPCVVFAVIKYPYRVKRMMIFMDPWSDQRRRLSDNTVLSAIGSGGIRGKGLKFRQENLFLPEAHMDFIFPIIGGIRIGRHYYDIISLYVFMPAYMWQNMRTIFFKFSGARNNFSDYFQAIFNIE